MIELQRPSNAKISRTTSERTYITMSNTSSVQSMSSNQSKTIDLRKHGIWSSLMEHTLVTMAPSLGMLNYDHYGLVDLRKSGTVFQVLTAYLLIGIPASYMQMVLGQYTHMGVFLLKRMAPIADGAGFAYCITIFISSMLAALEMQVVSLYFILTFVPGKLQWSRCAVKNCFEVTQDCNISGPCVNEVIHVAAYVYWNITIMQGYPEISQRHISTPTKEGLLLSTSLWIIIYLLSLVALVRLKKLVRHVTVIHLLTKTITAFSLLCSAGVVKAFRHMTVQSIINFNQFTAWREATTRVIVTMALGDFSHVMMGALSSDRSRVGSVAFLAGMLSFSSIFIDDILVNTAAIAMCDKVNLPIERRGLLFHPPDAPLHLIILPTTFDILPVPRLWNMMYFAMKIVSILGRVIFNIHFLFEAISHRFPTLSSYKRYASPMFCVLAWSTGILLQGKSAYHIRKNFACVTAYLCQYFNVFFFAATVSYIYGVRRFCDDVHFLRKSPPNLFWKITFMVLPIVLAVTIDNTYLSRESLLFKESLFEIILMFSPYLVLTTYEVIRKIIERKTITLITPENKWGPREVDRRAKRRQFNPRKSTRYMMDSLHCHHMCITNSKILKGLVLKEAQILSRMEAVATPEANKLKLSLMSSRSTH